MLWTFKRGKLGNKWDIIVFGCSEAQSTEQFCLGLGTGRKRNRGSLHVMRTNILGIVEEKKDGSRNSQRIWGCSKRGENSDSKRQTTLSWKSHWKTMSLMTPGLYQSWAWWPLHSSYDGECFFRVNGGLLSMCRNSRYKLNLLWNIECLFLQSLVGVSVYLKCHWEGGKGNGRRYGRQNCRWNIKWSFWQIRHHCDL